MTKKFSSVVSIFSKIGAMTNKKKILKILNHFTDFNETLYQILLNILSFLYEFLARLFKFCEIYSDRANFSKNGKSNKFESLLWFQIKTS